MKKRIYQILIFILCMFMFLSLFLPSLSAASYEINYNPFTDLVYVVSVDNTSIEVLKYAEINDGIMVGNDVVELDEYHLSGENTQPSGSVFSQGQMYLVKINNNVIDINYVILFNNFISQYGDSYYWQGYNVALDSSEQDILESGRQQGYSAGFIAGKQEGYDDGYADGQYPYSYGQSGYQSIFDAGKAAGEEVGRQEQIDFGETNLYTMLRQIALYPVKIFTEGLNVDIFGVNVGGVLLGLGILVVILFIFKKVRGL